MPYYQNKFINNIHYGDKIYINNTIYVKPGYIIYPDYIYYLLAFGLDTTDIIYPKNITAPSPAAAALKPPVRAPIKPV